ncbi:MAG: ABC transporter substrate-binding protein [Geminicoccaceae bacterium]|nr:ABC transporter substrate-binding protein [Geminicoccaceae bacterium]
MTEARDIHPLVATAAEQLARGKTDRRDFLRTATLLGMSAGAAYGMAGRILGDGAAVPAAAQETATPRDGGTLRVSMAVPEVGDPATFDWMEKANIARHVIEYLTVIGADNVTRPYLAESWEASDDLKTWTLHLRPGVTWHNGDAFGADDVVFNFERWLDPATGSSNQGLFAGLTEDYETGETNEDGTAKVGRRMRDGAVEKVDDLTVRLHLSSPSLSVPENLYEYPTAIVQRGFEANRPPTELVGTGPFTIVEHAVGERCILQRAEGAYWGSNLDDPFIGGPIHLDAIHYLDHGAASTAQLAAFASGQVDAIYEFNKDSYQMAEAIPDSVIYEAVTSHTVCIRMQVDKEPFTDHRVRRAIQLCCDAKRYPELIYQGRGMVGEHHHVAPIHPEYFPLPPLEQNHEEARRLLEEAGHGDGLALSCDCGNTNGPWQQQVLELFKQQLAPAGIDLTINLMPADQYWGIWDKTPFGITAWTHRPLATMTLSLGYRSGTAWNETHFADPEFDTALDEAEGLVDVEARRAAMEKVERILQDAAVMVQPIWQPIFFIASAKVKGMTAHPTQAHQYHKVWIDA